jgi:hypothetical protein
MNVNVWDVVQPIQALIRRRRPVDPERLADPSAPLEELAGGKVPADPIATKEHP